MQNNNTQTENKTYYTISKDNGGFHDYNGQPVSIVSHFEADIYDTVFVGVEDEAGNYWHCDQSDLIPVINDHNEGKDPNKSETEVKEPLYKVLNEKRLGEVWVSDDDGCKDKNGDWVATFGGLHTTKIADKNNAKYAALAVNNLAPIADALKDMLWLYENGESEAQKQGRKRFADCVAEAKEALSKIS